MSPDREQELLAQLTAALERCRALIPAEQAAAVLPVLTAAVAVVEAERDALLAELDGRDEEARERWIQKQLGGTGIRAVDFRNGVEMELEPAREILAHWVAAARTMLGDAPNYTETKVSMDVKVAESPELYTLVVQRHAPGTLTPHEARQKAEKERDEARAEVDRLTVLLGQYADRGIVNGERADKAEAGLNQARAAQSADTTGEDTTT